ncbi:PqqD family peptide modification chaperone [Azonexus sp.]|uniref:PqqD family peptide modification chaperone n=1 Tax=Azonexus sp. TaxID=1872668 RepID=UPI0039E3CFEC
MNTLSESAPEPLFSPRWHRVCTLRPRLRTHVNFRRQIQRGVDWFVLIDTSTQEVRRINPSAYAFVGRCDGRATVGQIWDALLQTAPDEILTQDEVVHLLTSLHERQLLEFDSTPDLEALFQHRDLVRKRLRRHRVNPLAFRLPLANPSRWLTPLAPLAVWLFSGWGLLLWGIVVGIALLAAAPHSSELAHEAARLTRSPQALTIGWLLYPFIKLVHELAHGLALLRWHAVSRQAGITVLMLTPVPFIDASAADAIRQPHRRAIISAAGIMAELFIAALALGLWLLLQPGLMRDLALTAVLIGTLSTLLVNGNPLLRFDGYFVFCDLLDLRNLATRSARWWQGRLRRWLLADRQTPPMESLPGEKPWLVFYAPLSAVYRLALCTLVALWIGNFSSLLGLVAGGFMLSATLGKPLWLGMKALHARPGATPWLRVGALLTALILVLCWPLPYRSLAQGVVSPPENALIRAGTDGFVTQWLQIDGQAVPANTAVALLEDDELMPRRAALVADIAEYDVLLFSALTNAPDEAAALREKLAFSQIEIARLDERLAALTARTQSAGTLVVARQIDQQGSWRRRGELLGYLLNDEPLTLRVALPHADAALLQGSAPEVQVRLASNAGQTHAGRIVRDLSGAVSQLPSAALSEQHGGPLATRAEDTDALTAQAPVVLLDVAVPDLSARHIGERGYVRIDHGHKSLAARALRQLRQLLLSHFNPSV